MNYIIDLIKQTSPLELWANIILIASVFLAAKNNVHQWWVGIIGCSLFAVVFYRYQLYADVHLQIFYVLTSIWGWWYWLHGGGRVGNHICEAPVRRSSAMFIFKLIIPTVFVGLGYGMFLKHYTDAYAPFWDTGILVFSLIGQYLLMARRVETWWAWLIVDSIAVPLYHSRGLDLTAIVYALLWCNVWYGLYKWNKELIGYDRGNCNAKSVQ